MEIERLREPCPKWAANEIDRLRAELANLHKWNREAVAAYKAKEAELAEARRALIAGNDTVLANKKLQEDNAAKDVRIAETERCRDNAENALESQQKWHLQMTAEFRESSKRDNTALEAANARIAELEAAGNRLGSAAITGILNWNDSRARAERAEAQLKVMREALKDMIEITEDIPHYAQRARAALAPFPADE